MATSRLYQVLHDYSDLDPQVLDALQAELDNPEDGQMLGELVVRKGLMPFSDMMSLALTHNLIPKTQTVLKRIAKARQQHRVIKPMEHVTRYRLGDDDKISEMVVFPGDEIQLKIPRPNLARYSSVSSDERQVVEMTVELVNINQLREAERFLIDAREEFPKSVRVPLLLVWLYFLCQRFSSAWEYCNLARKDHPTDINLLEYQAFLEQCLGKHLLAVNHYQQLTLLANVKNIWYLLLAYSLEHAGLARDAALNYRIFLKISQQEELNNFVKLRLEKLAPQ